MSWRADAACAKRRDLPWDTDAGVMARGPGAKATAIREAVAVCKGCPVRRQCLDDADRSERQGVVTGIRGGLTAPERRGR